MTDIKNVSETQRPGSFNDFIRERSDLSDAERADQVAAYSAEILQPNIKRLAEHAGSTAVSPLIQSIGRNDG